MTVGLKFILKKALMSDAIKNRTDDAEVAALKRLPAGSRRGLHPTLNILLTAILPAAQGFAATGDRACIRPDRISARQAREL